MSRQESARKKFQEMWNEFVRHADKPDYPALFKHALWLERRMKRMTYCRDEYKRRYEEEAADRVRRIFSDTLAAHERKQVKKG